MPPVRPMLAKSVKGIPDPEKFGGLSFEPKWDGFRCIVFRDGDEVELASRNTKPLTRYFPEVVAAIKEQLPERCVLDGELFVRSTGRRRLEFETLQERIHPAKSRVDMLAEKTPAGVRGLRPAGARRRRRTSTGRSPSAAPRSRRRSAASTGPCYLTRTTTDPAEAEAWFERVRGRRARRRGRQAAGGDVPAERPHHAQDQARAHRRRGGRRLPRAQDVDARAAAARQPAARACTTTASCSTSASAPSFTEARRAELIAGAPAAGGRRSRSTRGAAGRSS